MRRLLAALTVASAAWSDPGAGSVLGLEPGDIRLQNDDLGIILWGPDDAPTLSVGKSDVWDRWNPAPSKPTMTMEQIMALARAGDDSVLNGKPYYSAYDSYDFPCPKPAGQLILQLPFVRDGGLISYSHEEDHIRLHAEHGGKSLDASIFVSAVRNLIVMRGTAANLAAGDVAVRLYRHRDTILPGGELHPTIGGGTAPSDFEQLPMPRAGQDGDVVWVAQDYFPDPTFPDGFQAVLAARVVGGDIVANSVEGETKLGTPMIAPQEGRINHAVTKRFTPINDSPGSAATATVGALSGAITLLATVSTTQDDSDPAAHAVRTLREAAATDALWDDHRAQLDRYAKQRRARAWTSGGRMLFESTWGGVPYRVRSAGYYGDVALCSVASTKFCFQDSSPWHGDFHFNEIDATGSCLIRQFDVLDSYYQMMLSLLPMAQANARDVYACSGAMYPLVHYPLKADTVIHVNLTWEQSMEISALLARPFWLRFQYTWDMEFLREKAYPVLCEVARFYADYLKHEDDGLYHVCPTVSPEHRGITKDLQFNRDSQSGITLIRYHLRAAATAAELLDVDTDEAARWSEIAGHMPDYPTVAGANGTIYVDVAGGEPIEYNIPVPLSSVFWGDDIGLDSPPAQLELARRTLAEINVWEPHRGYLTRVRARLGIYDPKDTLSVEHLLQSHTGCMRVFPAVPADFVGGFENLGAQGAFVVSAERVADGVKEVVIESLASNRCVFANPWPEAAALIVDTGDGTEVASETSNGYVRFATIAGHVYKIEKSAQ